jgi:glycosyltransferase involved in cell wall biosynthesis
MSAIATTYEVREPAIAVPVARTSKPRLHPETPNVFVVPAFNEIDNLPRLLADFERRPELFPVGSRLIVVDDGSSDGTPQWLAAYDGCVPTQLIAFDENRGPGAAFRAGFEAALAACPADANIVTLEADTTSDLNALHEMLAEVDAGAGLVLASVHGGGRMVNVSFLRRFLSKCAGRAVRLLLGIDARTVSSFFRVYRASVMRQAVAQYGDGLITESGFACKAELLAKIAALGTPIEEVPVDLDGAQRVGESKMRLGPTFAGYWRLFRAPKLADDHGGSAAR